jgi:hypothetical protein
MQAIVTRYHGPGNVRGSRISATASAGRVILEWDDALNQDQNHAAACAALVRKFAWGGRWIAGGLPNSNDQVHVCEEGSC